MLTDNCFVLIVCLKDELLQNKGIKIRRMHWINKDYRLESEIVGRTGASCVAYNRELFILQKNLEKKVNKETVLKR